MPGFSSTVGIVRDGLGHQGPLVRPQRRRDESDAAVERPPGIRVDENPHAAARSGWRPPTAPGTVSSTRSGVMRTTVATLVPRVTKSPTLTLRSTTRPEKGASHDRVGQRLARQRRARAGRLELPVELVRAVGGGRELVARRFGLRPPLVEFGLRHDPLFEEVLDPPEIRLRQVARRLARCFTSGTSSTTNAVPGDDRQPRFQLRHVGFGLARLRMRLPSARASRAATPSLTRLPRSTGVDTMRPAGFGGHFGFFVGRQRPGHTQRRG